MKKLKQEAELFKAALLAGVAYAEGRKAVEFEATDSASAKALYVYRLLVHDKVIAPMPEETAVGRAAIGANREELTPLSFLERSVLVFPDRVAVVHGDRTGYTPTRKLRLSAQ